MRRLAIFPVSLALLLASLMMPYQHVHLRAFYGPGHADNDDDDTAIVHIHFYAVILPAGLRGHSNLSTPGNDLIAHALDTFEALAQVGFPALALPAVRTLLLVPCESPEQFLEPVEACGHDPPVLCVSVPRAPPA